MPILDELWDTLSDAAHTAAAATKEVTDCAKLNIAIAAEKSKIKGAYTVLGKCYFEALEAGKPIEGAQFDAQMELIRQSMSRINQLKQENDVFSSKESDAPTAEAQDFEPSEDFKKQ